MGNDVDAVYSAPTISPGFNSPAASHYDPSKPVLLRTIAIRDNFSKIGETAMHRTLNGLERAHTEIQHWTKERLSQQLNQSWTDQAWGFFSAVSTLCSSLVSVGMGVYVTSSGSASAGNAMIAAGVLDIVRELFTQMGIWDRIADSLLEENEQDIKERLKRELPLILSLLNVACSLSAAQGLGSYKNLMGAVQNGLSLVNAGGQGYFSHQRAQGDVKTAEIRTESEYHRHLAEVYSRLATALMEDTKRLKDILKKTAVSMMETTSFAAQKI